MLPRSYVLWFPICFPAASHIYRQLTEPGFNLFYFMFSSSNLSQNVQSTIRCKKIKFGRFSYDFHRYIQDFDDFDTRKMPQLDSLIVFPQMFWFFITFGVFYFLIIHYFSPNLLISLRLRKHVITLIVKLKITWRQTMQLNIFFFHLSRCYHGKSLSQVYCCAVLFCIHQASVLKHSSRWGCGMVALFSRMLIG